MAKPSRRLAVFLSQVFFTAALIPLFVLPRLTRTRLIKWVTAFFFGRLPAKHYNQVINFYGEAYGTALRAALEMAMSLSKREPAKIIDCGTGTGFAAREAASRFNRATVVGVDLAEDMVSQARHKSGSNGLRVLHVFADILYLPFRDGEIDLVIAQNTIPFLAEFARVCRPGGAVVFVDTAARWVTPLARYAARQTGCFDEIAAEQAGLGFYLVGRRTD